MPVNLGNWEEYYAAFSKVCSSEITEIVEAGATAAVVKLDQITRDKLPPPPRQRKQPFKTDKQRRWWWATMHKKARGQSRALPGWQARYSNGQLEISGAYRRTGSLVQSFTYKVSTSGSTTRARYGTNRKHAAWVVDEKRQSFYHKGNWTPLQQLARDNTPVLVQTFADTTLKEIERRLS
jgi:hypothetical protein